MSKRVTQPPELFNVHVSSLGCDQRGDGTNRKPFLTFQRALAELRDVGWNKSATITILAAGGNFILPSGDLFLNAGNRGAQETPLRIRGSGRARIAVGSVIGGSKFNPCSGLLEVKTGGPSFTDGHLGQMLRFTSGRLSSSSQDGPFASAVPIDVAIAAVLSTNVVRLPYGGSILPKSGDKFVIETFKTTLEIKGSLEIHSDQERIVFEDLNILAHPVDGHALFLATGCELVTRGLSVLADSGTTFAVGNFGANWISGVVADSLAGGLEI